MLYGETAEERPCTSLGRRITVTDLHATLYHALGIPPNYAVEVEKRPFYPTEDGEGEPVRELLA